MRPLTLVLAGVLTVAAAYAIFFWRNASEVREQLENEQAAERTVEELPAGDSRSSFGRGNQTLPPPNRTLQAPRLPGPSDAPTDSTEAGMQDDPSGSASTSQAQQTATAIDENPEMHAPSEDAEIKENNYSGLERTGLQIASAIQRQMREGEILTRGRGIGAALLRYVGYPVDANGEHTTSDGNFMVEIKGPDLIVVTATSEAFGNQMEVSIIGPRDVDRRVRRLR